VLPPPEIYASAVTSQRDTAVDLSKTVAIGGVLIIHLCGPAFQLPYFSGGWLAALFWGGLSRAAVPLFLICSGVLLLDPCKPLSIHRLYRKYLPRLLAALFFWAAAYQLFHGLAAHGLSTAWLQHSLQGLLLFQHEAHLYYLHIALLFYALLPLLRLLARHASTAEYRYTLALWFICGILYPTLRRFAPFNGLGGIPAQWLLNMTWAAAGYGLLGYYLKTHPLSRRCAWTILCTGLAVIWGGTIWLSADGMLDQHFMEGMSVGPCLLAIGCFSLLQTIQPGKRLRAISSYLARASFCIYLIHIFFIYFFAHFGIDVLITPPLLGIPILTLLVCGSSCTAYEVLRRFPFVNKYLI